MASVVLDSAPLGFQWATLDPFLFCVHHDDDYPEGNEQLGPNASLAGRDLGQDFTLKDGWRMYHGRVVPGFPQHPHRGFETVTIARRGFIDHSDSLGAAARFGRGDVQWMTAGGGIVHSEMFPLLASDAQNPVELFQIWMNLPAEDKLVPPHFSMLWSDTIPRLERTDAAGRRATVTVIAGELDGARPPSPPPHSWASRAQAHVAIWSLVLEPGARLALPAAPSDEVVRTLYFCRGSSLRVNDHLQTTRAALVVRPDVALELEAGDDATEVLVLQGRPIGEPVAQHGPFVMNTRAELQQAFGDYQRTRFGGWPWPSDGPVHPRDEGRFARRPDGTLERPSK
ncbi:MAG: pirin family protein [Deltaproteobacteria bacterium]|nr:pirin family protein [Deltaproteobacteria bacterium]